MAVRIQLHDDVAAFARLARTFYDTDPVRHTLVLTVLEGVRRGTYTPALMLTLHRGGEVRGAALRTAGRGVLVSGTPAVCSTAVDAAAAVVDPAPAGVAGPVDRARAYAAAVAARTGRGVEVAMRQRLFRLVVLQAPTGVTGTPRRAAPGDLELLAGWQSAFLREAAYSSPEVDEDPRPGLRAGLPGIHLWEVDGRPVAYASARTPVAAMSRIGPVYTPPQHRGHGYGTAVTAAATAWAQASGARDVVLFTDLANPVSNAIYPRIGYRPVEDTVELAFT